MSEVFYRITHFDFHDEAICTKICLGFVFTQFLTLC